MYVMFVLAIGCLSAAGGVASWLNRLHQQQAAYEAHLERQRKRSGALALMADQQRRTLNELEHEVTGRLTPPRWVTVERPRLGQPERTEIVNVTSLNQQGGVTAGKIERPILDIDLDEPIVLDGVAPAVTVDTRPWPDRHPRLYRHLPWPVRHHIITRYLRD